MSTDAVHDAFGLSYAHYLVWPRVLMQEMPAEWQERFIGLWTEFGAAFDNDRIYDVRTRGEAGRYERDPFSDYRHPNWLAIDRARIHIKDE